tara:strand:+ start:149 stop:1399 length:1251 start_codon:yes stop_codon:yes gene_type:complete
MTEPTIRIDDLGAPQLTPMQRQAIAAAPPVHMQEEPVLAAAQQATGLSDFGAGDFRERLSVWLMSFDEDRGLGPLGRAGLFNDAVRYASNRLLLEDLLKRNPDIAEVVIDRPIIIAGLPRSGTTNLVNILAADERLRSMPLWEAMQPIPAPGQAAEGAGEDPRFTATKAVWSAFESLLPLMPAMHEMAPDHVHEDIELQALDFSTYLPEWLSRPYRWRDYYYAHDQTPHYAYGKKVLQAMTWQRGPSRWVMKSPPHMENLVPLQTTYPDATYVITHRDPLAVLQSAMTMIAYGDRLRRTHVDLGELADYWIERIERLLLACVRDRERLPEAQTIDVLFHEYMADQSSTVEKIYAMAGLELDSGAARSMQRYSRANPRGKHGKVSYDLAGDFGIDVAALRERFAFYYSRFPVQKEVL